MEFYRMSLNPLSIKPYIFFDHVCHFYHMSFEPLLFGP